MQSNVDLRTELAENQLGSIEDRLNRLIKHRHDIMDELTLEDFSSKAVLKNQPSDADTLDLEPQVKEQVIEQRTLEAAYRQLLLDFESGLADLIPQYSDLKDVIERGTKTPYGQGRERPKRLIVTLSNGTEIEHGEQWKTFVEAIQLAGTKRVCEEKFGTPTRPLVKRKNTDIPLEDGYRLDNSGDYGIYTNYSAEDKADHLKEISEKFGLQWKVEVYDHDSEDQVQKNQGATYEN